MNEIDKLKAITQALRIARRCSPNCIARLNYFEMLKPENKLSVKYLSDESNKHYIAVHMMATDPNGQCHKLSVDTFI